KAHVTEILRKLKLFSRNKAVIEIGKISLPVPKKRGSNKGESAFPESGDHKPAEMGGMAKRR
ncbi:hypothetical protein ABTL48_20925, partial [Acinetobacter baumannii]